MSSGRSVCPDLSYTSYLLGVRSNGWPDLVGGASATDPRVAPAASRCGQMVVQKLRASHQREAQGRLARYTRRRQAVSPLPASDYMRDSTGRRGGSFFRNAQTSAVRWAVTVTRRPEPALVRCIGLISRAPAGARSGAGEGDGHGQEG